MKISYSVRSNLYALLYLVISVIAILGTYVFNSANGFYVLSIAITIELCFFLLIMKKASGYILSFATIFVLILAVFHFGQIFICGYWPDLITELKLRIVLNYFPNSECIAAMRIINISFVGICFGLILSSRNIEDYCKYVTKDSVFDSIKCEKHAIFLIVFTFPIKMIIDLAFFYLSFSDSFTNAVIWLGNFPDIVRTIGDFSMIGFGVLIVSLAYDKHKQCRVFVFIILYLLIQIISGRRSETISYIAIIAFLYYQSKEHKKRKTSQILIVVILGYLLLTLMYTTVRIRDLDNRTLEGFFELFWRLLTKQNIFMEAIREYGNTGYTPVCVLNNWLNKYNPSYGKSYVFGLSAILPNIGGLVSQLINSSTYAIQLQKYGMVLSGFKNIGGSVIGELFFNFGKIGGIVVSPVLGLFIGVLSQKVNIYIKTRQVRRLAYYIPAMYAILYWVRDCFGDGVREVVWGIMIWYFVGFVKTKNE